MIEVFESDMEETHNAPETIYKRWYLPKQNKSCVDVLLS